MEAVTGGDLRVSADLFDEGEAAARAGQPVPENASDQFRQGWAYGNTDLRIQAGEVLGFVCGATRCAKCGSVEWGNRLGCRCWPMDSERNPFTEEGLKRLQADGYRVDWGVLVVDSCDRTKSTFLTPDELLTEIQVGKPLVDCFSGEPIPL